MAHELLVGAGGAARFIDARGPAWHRLGRVITRPLTATEALEEMRAPEVRLVPVPPVPLPGGGAVDPRTHIIVRMPTDDLPAAVFGRVSPEYHLVTPRAFCRALDGAVGRPIETIGMLREGAILFVTYELPEFSVGGDEHRNYLVVSNGMTGQDALRALNAPVRVVCMNTYRAADALASEEFRIPHSASAMRELGKWVVELYARAVARGEALAEVLDLLARHRASRAEAEEVVAAAYPLPRRPSDFGPRLVVERRERRYEQERSFALGMRETALALWDGAGTGADTRAARGTLFGVYNAVVEAEDYRAQPGASVAAMAEAALEGRRAERKQAAFAAAARLAGWRAGQN
jgi:phage/plasmid-like protein (TIGR03299 family)